MQYLHNLNKNEYEKHIAFKDVSSRKCFARHKKPIIYFQYIMKIKTLSHEFKGVWNFQVKKPS